jgi:tetratricopeptide (TPR) repeat protein
MIPEILNKARRFYRAGNLARAEKACRQILDHDAANVPTWFLLGLVNYQAGKDDKATQAFRQALRLKPDYPEAYNNLGICQARQRKFAEAADSFRAALALRSEYPEALSNLGNALRDAGQHEEASEHYARAIALSPGYAEAHNNLGIAHSRQGNWIEAAESYRRAIELQPKYAEAHNNIGSALGQFAKFDEAVACFDQAIECKPAYAEAHSNRGIALAALGRWPDAAAAFRRAVQLQPRLHEAHNRLGLALVAQGELQEAAAAFRQAVQLAGNSFEAHRNLGNTLFDLDELSGAIEAYGQALKLRTDCADTHCQLAIALTRERQFAKGVQHFGRAIQLRPDFAKARMHRGLNRLQSGDFERGWTDFEWRLKCKGFDLGGFSQPFWQGEPIDGRRILIHAGPGLANTLQFVRYARLIKERGATVLLRVARPLVKLLGRMPDVDQVFSEGEELPDFDLQVPLLSLPKVFGTTLTTIPAVGPYLSADPELVSRWRDELAYIQACKVGLAWQGDPKSRGDARRSIPLAHFAPLASVPGVRLISLQKGFGVEQLRDVRFSVTDLGVQLDESSGPFMDTAAVMKNLDLLITSDSALAHLAGGLGIPTWLALPYSSDWRWLLHREDCPWYPTMRLIRQTEFDNWEPVFDRMAGLLGPTLKERKGEDSSALSISALPATATSLNSMGVHLAEQGRLDEAIANFRQALELMPTLAEAHNNLGNSLQQQGRSDLAVKHLRQALRLKEDYPEAWNNLGLILSRQRKLEEAAEAFQRALQLRPGYFRALSGIGQTLLDRGKNQEAEATFRQILQLEPKYYAAQLYLAQALANQQKWEDAAACFRQLIAWDSNNVAAYIGLAKVQRDQQKLDEAAECLERALALRPQDFEAHNDLGIVRGRQGKHEEALRCYEAAIRLRPNHPAAYNNLGIAYANQGNRSQAIINYRHALQLKPDYAEAHNNLAIVLTQEGKFDEAVDCYRRALELRGTYAEAHSNLGIALTEVGRTTEAIEHFDRALELRPEYADAYMNRALTYLLEGDFERGWRDYEWRWKTKDFNPRRFSQPAWQGEPIEGRRILIHSEQGMGDTFQFIRYARLIKERGATVLVRAAGPLVKLLRQIPYLDGVFPEGGEVPDFDVHLPLLSMPKVFGTTVTTVPAGEPYLFANPELVSHWRDELAYIRAFKVGITWQGNPKFRGDARRSIPLAHFAALASVPGVRLIGLQKGLGTEQIREARFSITDLGGQLDETAGPFMDTAAVIKNLDLVVAIDSSLNHLAGGLGIPTWLVLPYAPDWRWMMQREDSPWYPKLRIFRQTEFDNWEPIFQRMAEQLANLVRSRRPEFNPPLSLGEFCDYWTIRRIQSHDDHHERQNALTDLRHLDTLGHALAIDPDSQVLLTQLEETNQAIAELRSKLLGLDRRKTNDSSVIDLALEFCEREARRVRLIEELDRLPAAPSANGNRQFE